MNDNHFKNAMYKYVFMKLSFSFILMSMQLFVLCNKPLSRFGNARGESPSVACSSKHFVN